MVRRRHCRKLIPLCEHGQWGRVYYIAGGDLEDYITGELLKNRWHSRKALSEVFSAFFFLNCKNLAVHDHRRIDIRYTRRLQ